MDGRALAHGDLVKIVELASIVLAGEEAGLTAVAARDDVLRHIGDVGPGKSWQAGRAQRVSAEANLPMAQVCQLRSCRLAGKARAEAGSLAYEGTALDASGLAAARVHSQRPA